MSEIALTPEQEVSDAEALYEALEERIREGDTTVTPGELEKARGLARFAQLRVEAAQRKAERDRVEAERAAVEAAVADLTARAMAFEKPNLRKLEDAAAKAVSALLEAAKASHQELFEVASLTVSLEAEAPVHGVVPPSGHGVLAHPEGVTLVNGSKATDVRLAPLTVQQVVRSLLEGSQIATYDASGDATLLPEVRYPHFQQNKATV